MILEARDVTACLVTRGDQPEMMRRILASLIFDDVLIWDNSEKPDRKTFGRYAAMRLGAKAYIYFQDDDVIVPPETQQALVNAHEPGIPTATYAHGPTPAGYDDLPLVCGGAIVDWHLPGIAANRYLTRWPEDEAFYYYCDFAIGVLYPSFKHVRLPFDIQLEIAQHPSRLCNQPFAAEMKAEVTARARAIRDGAA